MERLWPNSFVAEANLPQHISTLRKKLSDGNDNHRYIETIPKRGYRFTATVKEIVQEHADNNGQWVLVISATIKDIDKPIAAAIEAHLRKLSRDVTLTLLRIEDGSVILVLESTRAGFERISELVESGQLSEVSGFDIRELRWGLRPERVKAEPQHEVRSYPEDLSHRKGTLALTQPAFDKLLLSFDIDREQAAIRYQKIRQQLIKFFTLAGAEYPQELADTTIDRVAKRIEQGAKIIPYSDSYFFRVARNIYFEYFRSRFSMRVLQMENMKRAEKDAEDEERKHECSEKCWLSLSVDKRELLLKYYKDNESKIEDRKNLAAELGITLESLRVRVLRIRSDLRKCISDCMERSSTDI